MDHRIELAVEAGAIAFHDAVREKRFLRWSTSSEAYREEIRALVRPAIVAAIHEYQNNGDRYMDTRCSTCGGGPAGAWHKAGCPLLCGMVEEDMPR